MTPAPHGAHAPTVRLTTIGAQSAAVQHPADPPSAGGGLPRRVRESVRTENPPSGTHRPGTAGQHRSSPDDRSVPEEWPDETAAFAAGVSAAQATTSTDEGQQR